MALSPILDSLPSHPVDFLSRATICGFQGLGFLSTLPMSWSQIHIHIAWRIYQFGFAVCFGFQDLDLDLWESVSRIFISGHFKVWQCFDDLIYISSIFSGQFWQRQFSLFIYFELEKFKRFSISLGLHSWREQKEANLNNLRKDFLPIILKLISSPFSLILRLLAEFLSNFKCKSQSCKTPEIWFPS